MSEFKKTSLLRLDREETIDLDDHIIGSLVQKIKDISPEIILFSDYKKGAITQKLTRQIISFAKKQKIKVFVDTKRSDISIFSGVDLLKPNNFELTVIKAKFGDQDMSDREAVKKIYTEYRIDELVLTKGENGIDRYSKGQHIESFPGKEVIPLELSGAGDSVLATIGYCTSIGKDLSTAVQTANLAASKYIVKGAAYELKQTDLKV